VRVVLEVLRAGAELAEHRAPGPITAQLLEGTLRFHPGDQTFRIRDGEMLSLPSRQPHRVEAVCDSAFLITIAPEREEARVQE
jgi:quercetin dioxygenase-like cupin family protein